MSEVSLKAAHGAYGRHRKSDSVEALCESVVKGQAEYGYTITHVYSFIDVNDTVSLFYCRDGDHEGLLTSPFVRKRALLWELGRTRAAPRYLQRAYADLLRAQETAAKDDAALRVGFVPGNTGTAIRQRLKALGCDLRKTHVITFQLEVNADKVEWLEKSLRLDRDLERRPFVAWRGCMWNSGRYTLSIDKEIAVDESHVCRLAATQEPRFCLA